MSKMKTCIAFVTGALVGSVATAVVLRRVFTKMLDERVASVEDAFRRYNGDDKPEKDIVLTEDNAGIPAESVSDLKRANALYRQDAESKPYTDYVGMYKKPDHSPEVPVEIDGEEERERQDYPYVISPDEFGEYSEYNTISLVCFEDGVITDGDFEILENYEEHIGRNACDHFGDYEDDAVHIRNDAKQCDYEILRDERLYAEAIAHEPRPIHL